jgi:hypothetical protein
MRSGVERKELPMMVFLKEASFNNIFFINSEQ